MRKMTSILKYLTFAVILLHTNCLRWSELNLPEEHMAMFFNENPELAERCENDKNCPFKIHLYRPACWGYETNCSLQNRYSHPSCPGDHKGWVRTKEEQLETFYEQGDFGYVQEQRSELKIYCHSDKKGGSWLECTDHLRFCRGKNIYIDFRHLMSQREVLRYSMDVLRHGQIGGHCKLDKKLLDRNADQISPLQSWGPEMRHFVELKKKVEPGARQCDRWVETPVYIMKLDAYSNMYHHFCDFFNLYAAQHVNSSDEYAFSQECQIMSWENIPYRSNFGPGFDVFSNRLLWNLDTVAGERVCFRNVVFPLLPRMIFGLYYNTPIIWGCEKSGLFHAFSRHVLHRLGISPRKVGDGKIHITLLSRETQYRRILNQAELIKALEDEDEFLVRRAEFSHLMDFRQQLFQDQWTDIFIGMHGAGLTHLLFLPDWAVIFELYNCGDPNCYKDLARLRGIKYITWEDETKLKPQDEGKHPDGGAHEKFTNYEFDAKEFVRLVKKAASHVKSHRGWKRLQERLEALMRHTEL
ncbi:EGF domain-specific O-linked N-acetylglucosamine transferase [Macrobrachium rosenbergii]|uniref:EGF domain-specific O-linked N-acetylglucosamine transferase n=1 Tax=Macrobrachium rosenbergii TaxID=79674 RepID=UPI0034D43E66